MDEHPSKAESYGQREDDSLPVVADAEVMSRADEAVQVGSASNGERCHVGWVRHLPVIGPCIATCHPHFLIAFACERFMVKGIAHGFMRFAIQPMLLNRYKLSALRYQRLSSLYRLGWSINAFFIALCDSFPLLKYTKRFYMFLFAVAGAGFQLGFGLLHPSPSSDNAAAAFMFLVGLSMCNVDVLSQGFMSREMKRVPAVGPPLVSWAWWMALLGALIAACVQGPLTDNNKTQLGLIIGASLLFAMSFLFLSNLYHEKPNIQQRREDALLKRQRRECEAAEPLADGTSAAHTPPTAAASECPSVRGRHTLEPAWNDANGAEGVLTFNASGTPDSRVDAHAQSPSHTHHPPHKTHTHARDVTVADMTDEDYDQLLLEENLEVKQCAAGVFQFNKDLFVHNWRIVALCALLTLCVVAKACVTILGSKWDLVWTCIAITVATCGAAFLTLPLAVAKAAVFIYFNQVFYLLIPGATNTFYVANEQCVPGGPNFSYTFFNLMTGVLGNVAGCFGIVLFNYIFAKRSYRLALITTTVVQILASIFDLIMIERWNIYIGIPDHAMFIFGDAVVLEICEMLNSMPTMVLMARVCPRGTEAMVVAIMSAFSYAGSTTSTAIASILMETHWPIVAKVPCDFHNGKWLIITGHMLTPLLAIPLCFLLLPAARICDNLDSNGHAIPEEAPLDNTGAVFRRKDEHSSGSTPSSPSSFSQTSERAATTEKTQAQV